VGEGTYKITFEINQRDRF